jgi:tRNA dimethylallyltransferase
MHIICGQTATGKSDLAVLLARNITGHIISADSRQVYRDVDILSNKITIAEMQNVPHYLLDVADPGTRYNAQRYQHEARATVQNILDKGTTPIICGGTGLYIDSLVYTEYDFASTVRSESNARHSDTPLPQTVAHYFDIPHIYSGLYAPREYLIERIRARTQRNFVHVIQELENLITQGITREWLSSLGLEPRFGLQFLQNEISYDTYCELLTTKTIQYAKRQMTWFKRNPRIHWYDISAMKVEEIIADIQKRSADTTAL